ncbi:MAG TPA: NAD+--asparagine ADP-ribosyltransferase [Bacillota bacterium]|nr:NAD+--asparagine ADP-ribosyltransferase [Bacillota bacterium]
MKKVWQIGFILLVLLGLFATTANCNLLPEATGIPGVVWGADAGIVTQSGQVTAPSSVQTRPAVEQTQALPQSDSLADREKAIADTITRAPQAAEEYVAAIRSGKLYGNDASFTVACVALDITNPALVGRGINGIWRSNPGIFKTSLTDSGQITALYRQALTDQYLDRLVVTEPARFKGKDVAAIKRELASLREMIQKTKDAAVAAGKYYKNNRTEPSFEFNWVVENCAEVWAVRDAILQGAQLENMVMRTVSIKNGKIKPLCRNCVRTFSGMIKAMD